MDGQCLKNLPVRDFKWVKKLSKLDEPFVKDYNENSDKGYFLEADVEYPKKIFVVIYHFYLKEIKFKNVISQFVTYKTKKTMLFT